MAIENRLYGAAGLERILGVKPEEAYLWSRTWGLFEPAKRSKGPRGRNKYSLLNLLQMALIRELLLFGFNLAAIKKMLSRPITVLGKFKNLFNFEEDKSAPSIWNQIVLLRDHYERNGAVLLIDRASFMDLVPDKPPYVLVTKENREEVNVVMATLKNALDNFRMFHLVPGATVRDFSTLLIIDLMAIVHYIEMATGEKLA